MSLVFVGSLHAGPAVVDATPETPSDDMMKAFRQGALDFQLTLGTEISIQATELKRPNIDYALADIRFGYMLDTAGGTNWLRGNDEVLFEVIGGPMYTGPGNALGGLSLLYRRNFVPEGARIVPYLNAGLGGIYTDAYHDRTQRALGAPFEFDIVTGIGLRYRITGHLSSDGEISYRHLSNADLATRNFGTNALGGLIGFTYSF